MITHIAQQENQMILGGYPRLRPRLPFHSHLTKAKKDNSIMFWFCFVFLGTVMSQTSDKSKPKLRKTWGMNITYIESVGRMGRSKLWIGTWETKAIEWWYIHESKEREIQLHQFRVFSELFEFWWFALWWRETRQEGNNGIVGSIVFYLI